MTKTPNLASNAATTPILIETGVIINNQHK